MKHVVFIIALAAVAFTVSGIRDAGCDTKKVKLLLIVSERGEPYQSVIDAFIAELSVQGYPQGSLLEITDYSLDHFEGRARRILQIESQTMHDIVIVFGTVGTKALKDLILDDPAYERVVFSTVTDPVGIGVIDNFRDPPPHNFTGVAYPVRVRDRFAFIRRVMPKARKIGLIYADMPQSLSYNGWVTELLASDPEFRDYEVIFRKVPFVKSKGGMIRMGIEAEKCVLELTADVDLFLSANDQLALQPLFPGIVYEKGTKPLVGVGKQDVMERRGATMAIFPSPEGLGRQTACIVTRLIQGTPLKEIVPEEVKEVGVAFDMDKVRQFGIRVPDDLLKQAGSNIVP